MRTWLSHQMQLREAYEALSSNSNIPKPLTKAVFDIMNDGACGKISKEEALAEVKELANAMKASCQYLLNMLNE